MIHECISHRILRTVMLVEEIKNKLILHSQFPLLVNNCHWNYDEQRLRLEFEPKKYPSVKKMFDGLCLFIVTETSSENGKSS